MSRRGKELPQINVQTTQKRKKKLDDYVAAKGITITEAVNRWIDRLPTPKAEE